ncbi:SIMPL domain-containing protein [Massilia sp. CF038]|uniref:SIMPL domain-containing protein n=1 Tax=Massilia sp. CF038 TaxID=1881045 RepID=UPI00090F6315|nr:SIMPL domain-containing protein [Massilia sp. CF038]SHG55253.1 Predicted secreted protein [Massilia sp. CF038]
MFLKKIVLLALMLLAVQSQAQTSLATAGTLVIVSASGQTTQPNDQAIVVFTVMEQDKDKRAAEARANQKMKEGIAILRKEAPSATLKSGGYLLYEMFADRGTPNAPRTSLGWRFEQEVRLTTTDLASLPKLAAAAQKVLGVKDVIFGLTDATVRSQDDVRIAATYRNLNERIASIATAMGRKVTDAVLESVDFDGASGLNGEFQRVELTGSRIRSRAEYDRANAEPSFEPGETTLSMRLVGKVRFK